MIKGILAENPNLNEINAQVDIGKTTIFNFMHLELNVKSYNCYNILKNVFIFFKNKNKSKKFKNCYILYNL